MTFDSVLVVCTGNVCRSPIGERLLRRQLPGKFIASAGIAAMADFPADPQALSVAQEYGLSLEGHFARQLTPRLIRDYDLILVMERRHIEAISDTAPEARGRTLLFSQWVDKRDIPDPYRRDREAFHYVYRLLDSAGERWSNKLGYRKVDVDYVNRSDHQA